MEKLVMIRTMKKPALQKKLLFVVFFLFLIPLSSFADSLGEERTFFLDSSFDAEGRDNLLAVLERENEHLYFYIDSEWWRDLSAKERSEINSALDTLGDVFNSQIYPTLVGTFGSEWKPGIDGDNKITVLLHPMRKGIRGYFRIADEYFKFQVPRSNEREMVYLSSDYITDSRMKSYLAHEFQHLITFNQKERKYGFSPQTWFQEVFSEYAPTLAGLNTPYEGSYLQERVDLFLRNPSDSLTEWRGEASDYGVLSLFIHYLAEHYGIEVLVNTLSNSRDGITAFNEALEKAGFDKDFGQVFNDWAVAVLANDCSLGPEFCYQDKNLSKIKIVPSLHLLPFVKFSNLQIEDSIKDWSVKWYRLIGGRGDLKLTFKGTKGINFSLAYLACKVSGGCSLSQVPLTEEGEGIISLPHFDEDYTFLALILSSQERQSNFSNPESSHFFTIEVSVGRQELTVQKLLAEIEKLKAEIAKLQAVLNEILRKKVFSCQIEKELYFGMKDSQVECLQEFLKSQGPEIYPEGLVTGYFGPLTRKAVIRFQEKYKDEILSPWGLSKGTGFVGETTRAKINRILSSISS